MKTNGTGITEAELASLPEVDAVLWQEEDGPTSVIDSTGRAWMIGFYKGKLCKRRHI